MRHGSILVQPDPTVNDFTILHVKSVPSERIAYRHRQYGDPNLEVQVSSLRTSVHGVLELGYETLKV